MFFLPQKDLCLFLFFLFCLLRLGVQAWVKGSLGLWQGKNSFKAARPEGHLLQRFRQVLKRAELKPATGNVGILSGSLWEIGDKQEEEDWRSQGFAERGHGRCRGTWVNTTLASMHPSRTGRLLKVLQFAPLCGLSLPWKQWSSHVSHQRSRGCGEMDLTFLQAWL